MLRSCCAAAGILPIVPYDDNRARVCPQPATDRGVVWQPTLECVAWNHLMCVWQLIQHVAPARYDKHSALARFWIFTCCSICTTDTK
jgi:hypothetical protein